LKWFFLYAYFLIMEQHSVFMKGKGASNCEGKIIRHGQILRCTS
jgi:hypothetical protein